MSLMVFPHVHFKRYNNIRAEAVDIFCSVTIRTRSSVTLPSARKHLSMDQITHDESKYFDKTFTNIRWIKEDQGYFDSKKHKNNSEMQVHACPLMTISLWDLQHLKWDFYVFKQEGSPNGPIFLQIHPFAAGRHGKHFIMTQRLSAITNWTFPKSLLSAAGGLYVQSQVRPSNLDMQTDCVRSLIESLLTSCASPDTGSGRSHVGWIQVYHFVPLTSSRLNCVYVL